MIDNFKKNGFHIEKSIIKENIHKELFFMFYDLSLSMIQRNNINIPFAIKAIENINYQNDIKELDKLMLIILKADNKLIGELYDTVSYSSTFLKLVSNSSVEEITRELLSLNKQNTIYSFTHRIRIDPPYDDRRTYGWHQEIFYSIPDTRFLQTWCPIIRDTTIDNGTIQICPGSHKEGLVKQTWNEVENRAKQILIDEKILNKYDQTSISMKVGEMMFFDPYLFHRSGSNTTKNEIRFSLVGQWHDTSDKPFRAPLPTYRYRTISAKDNYKKLDKS